MREHFEHALAIADAIADAVADARADAITYAIADAIAETYFYYCAIHSEKTCAIADAVDQLGSRATRPDMQHRPATQPDMQRQPATQLEIPRTKNNTNIKQPMTLTTISHW